MRIGGFQALSLLDFPGTPCSIIFTQGCPLRCQYCHNPDLVLPRRIAAKVSIDFEDIFSYISTHASMIRGVCITGGEPTLQKDLEEKIRRLRDAGFAIKLDTNGCSPRILEKLIADDLLDYVAMDIKAPWDRYGVVSPGISPVIVDACRESFDILKQSGVLREFRTTIFPAMHTLDDFFAMASSFADGTLYCLQDIRYETTLGSLDPAYSLKADTIVAHLRERFSALTLISR